MAANEPAAFDPDRCAGRQGQPVVQRGRPRARQQAEKRAVAGRPPPEHAQQERSEQRRVDKPEHELQHIHDIVELARHVGTSDADQDADHRDDVAHPQVVPVGLAGADVALVQIVRPDGVERGDVAGHARHERGHQGGDADAQQARGAEPGEHHRHGHVEIGGAVLVLGQEVTQFVVHGDGDHARQDHQGGKEHLGDGGNQRRPPGRRHRIRRHRPLDHQEVGAPVAEREHESQAHHHSEPLDAHRVGVWRSHVRPGLRPGAFGKHLARGIRRTGGHGIELGHQGVPSADALQAEPDQRHETEHDHEELQHLVVDRRGQSAQENVGQHDQGRNGDAQVVGEAENLFQEPGQGVHRDAGRKDGHHRERNRVERARFFVEPQLQVLRDRPGLRAVVERHHEDADEHHRRDRADPVEVAGHDPVLGPRGGHADDFLGAEVRRDEGQTADPGRNRPARQEEVAAGLHVASQRPPDAQHKHEIHRQNQVVDRGESNAEMRHA